MTAVPSICQFSPIWCVGDALLHASAQECCLAPCALQVCCTWIRSWSQAPLVSALMVSVVELLPQEEKLMEEDSGKPHLQTWDNSYIVFYICSTTGNRRVACFSIACLSSFWLLLNFNICPCWLPHCWVWQVVARIWVCWHKLCIYFSSDWTGDYPVSEWILLWLRIVED